MLYFLGHILRTWFGPFRLLSSRTFLIVFGLYLGFAATMWLLPKFLRFLPRDRGREYAAESGAAKGKPTGAGLVFVPIFVAVALLTVPFGFRELSILGLTILVCLSGFLDDAGAVPWGECKKGLVDLALALAAAFVLGAGEGPRVMWLPFTDAAFAVPPAAFIAVSVVVIWVSINATNCSDGVDGLSGTLALMAFASLGALLYFALGHRDIASYLLLPHYPDGADWAVMVFALAGCLAGYLWYNAFPSIVLMGDAGSRPIGFLIGVMAVNAGNPLVLLVIASMLLVNGGTGLVKVALLRFLGIRIFGNIRFPLHDHVRESRAWSNTQVLFKFALLQALITIGLFWAFLKVR